MDDVTVECESVQYGAERPLTDNPRAVIDLAVATAESGLELDSDTLWEARELAGSERFLPDQSAATEGFREAVARSTTPSDYFHTLKRLHLLETYFPSIADTPPEITNKVYEAVDHVATRRDDPAVPLAVMGYMLPYARRFIENQALKENERTILTQSSGPMLAYIADIEYATPRDIIKVAENIEHEDGLNVSEITAAVSALSSVNDAQVDADKIRSTLDSALNVLRWVADDEVRQAAREIEPDVSETKLERLVTSTRADILAELLETKQTVGSREEVYELCADNIPGATTHR